MASNNGLILSLGFDARGAFDEMVQSFEQKVKEMERAANKAKIGDQFSKQFDELWKKIQETRDHTDQMYEKLQEGGKIDAKGFEAFSQKVTSEFQDIHKQVEDLKTAMASLSDGKLAQGLAESFNNVKTQFDSIQNSIQQFNTTFGSIIQLSNKFGNSMNTVGDTINKNLKQLRKYYKTIEDGSKIQAVQDYSKAIGPSKNKNVKNKVFSNIDVEKQFSDDYNKQTQMLTQLTTKYRQSVEQKKAAVK